MSKYAFDLIAWLLYEEKSSAIMVMVSQGISCVGGGSSLGCSAIIDFSRRRAFPGQLRYMMQ
jgi:hypothetical protein